MANLTLEGSETEKDCGDGVSVATMHTISAKPAERCSALGLVLTAEVELEGEPVRAVTSCHDNLLGISAGGFGEEEAPGSVCDGVAARGRGQATCSHP